MRYEVAPKLTDAELNALIGAAWANARFEEGFASRVKAHSLSYLCAYDGMRLVGFVNVAWDGGLHAFLLDATVHPDYQRRGVGQELVRCAAEVARRRGVQWLHVDYEPQYEGFYQACGFKPTLAGLLRLEPAK